METIKTAKSVSGKVIELIKVIAPLKHEYYWIECNGELVYSQYDNNNKLNVIFNECINEEFDLIYS